VFVHYFRNKSAAKKPRNTRHPEDRQV